MERRHLDPVRGGSKVSPGCKFCYAELFANRFRRVEKLCEELTRSDRAALRPTRRTRCGGHAGDTADSPPRQARSVGARTGRPSNSVAGRFALAHGVCASTRGFPIVSSSESKGTTLSMFHVETGWPHFWLLSESRPPNRRRQSSRRLPVLGLKRSAPGLEPRRRGRGSDKRDSIA